MRSRARKSRCMTVMCLHRERLFSTFFIGQYGESVGFSEPSRNILSEFRSPPSKSLAVYVRTFPLLLEHIKNLDSYGKSDSYNSVEFIHCKFRIAQLSLDFSATTPRSQHSTYSGLGWVRLRGMKSAPFYLKNGMSWRKMLYFMRSPLFEFWGRPYV